MKAARKIVLSVETFAVPIDIELNQTSILAASEQDSFRFDITTKLRDFNCITIRWAIKGSSFDSLDFPSTLNVVLEIYE
jgi:hypothetical protein